MLGRSACRKPPADPQAIRLYSSEIVSLALLPAELAVMAAVKDVDREPNRQPDKEPKPGDDGQSRHQPAAKHNRNEREPRHKGHAEGTRTIRLPPPQKNNAQRDEDERK